LGLDLSRSGDHLGLRVAYRGSEFFGSQHQPLRKSVQSTLEKAFLQITRQKIRLSSLSRTDAGVHAYDAIFFWRNAFQSWTALEGIDFYRLWGSLNAVLPSGIQIRQLGRLSRHFSPKDDVLWKEYRYNIWNCRRAHPLLEGQVWWIYEPLNPATLQEQLSMMEGTHDFSSFSKSSAKAVKEAGRSAIRSLYVAKLKVHREPAFAEARRFELVFRADGFLHHMVRNMVGTLVDHERRGLRDMKKVLSAKNRALAGYRAPPEGLVLFRTQLKKSVFQGLYPKKLQWFAESTKRGGAQANP